MKKFFTALVAMMLVVSMMAAPAGAITTGKWDFQAGYDYAQQVIKDMQEQENAQHEEPEIPVDSETPVEPECPFLALVEEIMEIMARWIGSWRAVGK